LLVPLVINTDTWIMAQPSPGRWSIVKQTDESKFKNTARQLSSDSTET